MQSFQWDGTAQLDSVLRVHVDRWWNLVNMKQSSFDVILEHCWHVLHVSIVHVELRYSQQSIQFHPFHEHGDWNASEGHRHTRSEFVVVTGSHWSFDRKIDAGVSALGCHEWHVFGDGDNPGQLAGEQILDVSGFVEHVSRASTSFFEFNWDDVRSFVIAIPYVTSKMLLSIPSSTLPLPRFAATWWLPVWDDRRKMRKIQRPPLPLPPRCTAIVHSEVWCHLWGVVFFEDTR